MEFNLIPQPKAITIKEDFFAINAYGYICIDNRDLYTCISCAREAYFSSYEIAIGTYHYAPIINIYKVDSGVKEQGYNLIITKDGVSIEYTDAAGAFYGFMTLNQIMDTIAGVPGGDINEVILPCCIINDYPDFPVRGYMLDIGRNKVPKTEEILRLIDMLAGLKINHMELYIEGIPFAYKSYPEMWEGKDVMRGEDILIIDRYCKDRLIELVPTQNNFGHMDNWLYKEYRHLAECPEGFYVGEVFLPGPRCLNPFNPGSLELVKNIADDLLPYFSSSQYNICCDETIELGQGFSKETCEKKGKGKVYVDFLNKVHEIAASHGKTTLFWDDIIKHYPDLLCELPKDSIALEWGYYENLPLAENCKLLQDNNVTYYVCPGTACWNTLLGKTGQMLANITTAARNGLAYGAAGFLNTDWGDCGHLQSIATSYAGIAYGAAMSWGHEENEKADLAVALDKHIFFDKAGKMGKFVLDIGNYYQQEGSHPRNITLSFRLFVEGLRTGKSWIEGLHPDDFYRVEEYIRALAPIIDETQMQRPDAELIKDDYKLAIDAVVLLQQIGLYYMAKDSGDDNMLQRSLAKLVDKIPCIISRTKELWLIRNKYSYLDVSLEPWVNILNDAVKESKTTS